MKVSGSILSSTIKPKEVIDIFNKTSLDYIHIDLMDGKFVENKTYTMSDIVKFSSLSKKAMDVHLMVNNPLKYIDDLSMLNVSYITFHLEAVKKPMELIDKIKNNGLRVGISINPETKVEELIRVLPYIDLVLIMSVKPGKAGQKFMESVIYKLDVLKRLKEEKNYNFIISIDGGINDETFLLVKNKVDMVVSASYLLSGDTEEKIKEFKQL